MNANQRKYRCKNKEKINANQQKYRVILQRLLTSSFFPFLMAAIMKPSKASYKNGRHGNMDQSPTTEKQSSRSTEEQKNTIMN